MPHGLWRMCEEKEPVSSLNIQEQGIGWDFPCRDFHR